MSTAAQDPSDPVGLLLKEYCPPLDSAIVLAISLDYDSVDDARAVLDSLKAETIVDEADGAATGDADHSDLFDKVFSDEDTTTTTTTRTSTGSKSEHSSSSDGDEAALLPLVLMFPLTSKYTLKHTLQKCGGDVDRAIDELLNLKFLDGEGESLKGVDAFSEASMVHAKRNSKNGRKKGRKLLAAGNTTIWEELDAAAAAAGSAAGTGEPSKWEMMQSEISYLSNKLNLPLPSVTSTYHRHGSLSATLVALIEAFGEGDVVPEDASHIETISSIASKHPRLPQTHIVGLVKLCKDDIASAFKFAGLLNRRHLHKLTLPTSAPRTPNNGIASPVTPTSPSNGWQAAASPRRSTSTSTPGSLPMSPTSPPSSSRKLSYKAATLAATDHAVARSEAYNKASAAYRRSKSDHLMGAVATYYAEEGKTHDTRLKAYSDMAAEALVAENSSEYTLDLHGVTVAQALKITNERVTSWWVRTNSTDDKALTPFHIITGIGSHSKNGESRIGPAVSKMLMKGNWKIEIRTGNIRVLGVQKPVKRK
ncbi:hypothetical protein Dda_3977 [Drechslerella dactyloides]|uniref:Smr domain-containing protein n=1 Tax=Drechslerella dactyloides TaxID=74499 RepID=A0AAD6NLM3_DREDA|nr:hypothetical protein Dda_3977 [Drechslerella dactyloides]